VSRKIAAATEMNTSVALNALLIPIMFPPLSPPHYDSAIHF
jgi:hypothetical protein